MAKSKKQTKGKCKSGKCGVRTVKKKKPKKKIALKITAVKTSRRVREKLMIESIIQQRKTPHKYVEDDLGMVIDGQKISMLFCSKCGLSPDHKVHQEKL